MFLVTYKTSSNCNLKKLKHLLIHYLYYLTHLTIQSSNQLYAVKQPSTILLKYLKLTKTLIL